MSPLRPFKPPHNRRRFLRAVTGLAGFVAAPRMMAQAKPERNRVTVAVAGKAVFYSLPLTIADQLGYFRSEGLEVEINDYPGGAPALHAAQSGAADIVSGAYEHTINLQSKNQSFKAFVMQGRAPAIAIGVSNRALPHYRTLHDLKGRKIGVTAPGSSSQMLAKMVLAQAGLKADDVNFVGVGTSYNAVVALRQGQIDAISTIDPMMTMLEQKNDVRVIVDTRTLKGALEVFGGPMPAGCLYAPSEFLIKSPNTAQALTNGIVHALKWLHTAGPGDIIKTVPEAYFLGDRGLYLLAFSKVREALAIDGMVLEEGARTALRALASHDASISADKITLSRTYTNEFARRAKEKYKV